MTTRSSARRRRNLQAIVSAEGLETRQLLTDPMQEMNEKLAGAILMSNAQIESFFSGGSTEIVGELNGALGATATKFHQYPLGGVEIEDAVLTDIENAFGAGEGSVAAARDFSKTA